MRCKLSIFILFISLLACDKDEPAVGVLEVLQFFVGTVEIDPDGPVVEGLPVDRSLAVVFSAPLDKQSLTNGVVLRKDGGSAVSADISLSNGDKTLVIHPSGALEFNSNYALDISDQLKGAHGEVFSPKSIVFKTVNGSITITSIKTGGKELLSSQLITDIPVDNLTFEVTFSGPLNPSTINDEAFKLAGVSVVPLTVALSDDHRMVSVSASGELSDLRKYELRITGDIEGANAEDFALYSKTFYTGIDPDPDFPEIADDALLTLIQDQTLNYFWQNAHPASGMAKERNSSGNIVTSGGSGFGIMALIVGMERNFITRAEGLQRMDLILDFLEAADRFHGAWSHWIDGNTGDVIPFSANDNGGDLVETSYLIQGLLTIRQYLNPGVTNENDLILRINALWQTVEWDWYTREGENVLYWHWSPDKDWIMNHQIKGYNECLITYVLAASSPTHTIDARVYHEGWAGNGTITNGKDFYGIDLPLGFDYGGPLFFSHYSFLGLDPRKLADTYANYWTQNVNHTLINHAYAVANPKNFVGYSDDNWGFTASDNHQGYSAHSPTNDLGVISPTAAVSSLPYTPEESMKAIRFFYYTIGDRLWGSDGFYDAFNLTEGWTADSYLAIDQGPMIIMIENYRTGLLWDLFMSAPEVQSGLTKLGFTY
jgi:hypothetical protein